MDNYSRCATCKHYQPRHEFQVGWGQCRLLTGGTGDLFDLDPDYGHEWGGETRPVEVLVNDRFGCVLHEAKE